MWSFEACRVCFLSSGSMCGWRRHCGEISWSSPQHSALLSRASFCRLFCGRCAEHIWTMLNGSPRPETKQIIIPFVIAFSRRLVTYEWGLLQQNGAASDRRHNDCWSATDKLPYMWEEESKLWGQIPMFYFFFFFCSIIDEIISNRESL